jgi:hypothetical protein
MKHPKQRHTTGNMPAIYVPFMLRLHGHVFRCLCDHNFAGLDLFYRIKDCWKARDEPNDLLLRPLVPGLSSKISEWCFDTMFDIEGQSESMDKPYFKTLAPEDFLWFVEDVAEAARLSEGFDGSELLTAMTAQINEIGDLYEASEEQYWNQVTGVGRRKLAEMFIEFCRDLRQPLSRMRADYASEMADRILHDRQLCNFIARILMDIGFDGKTVEGLLRQWVRRERWPAAVKSILFARDRGKCAACNADIVYELRAEAHIDHMFPIAQGGCNDLVNLQILCSECNLTKLNHTAEVTSSVPRYTRRPKKRAGFD